MSPNDSIRPFRIDIPEESLEELRRPCGGAPLARP